VEAAIRRGGVEATVESDGGCGVEATTAVEAGYAVETTAAATAARESGRRSRQQSQSEHSR
jgi:hypothetical protein